jgi:hypothetical protein
LYKESYDLDCLSFF